MSGADLWYGESYIVHKVLRLIVVLVFMDCMRILAYSIFHLRGLVQTVCGKN